MYAHITAGTVDAVQSELAPEILIPLGWLPVTEAARPADTATTTWEPTFTPTGATVTQSWVTVPKSQEQLDAEAAEAARVKKAAEDAAILDAIAATASPPPDGGAWVQPTGAHDAYPLDATVTHNAKTWVSLIPFNVWEPGVSSWREQVAEGYPAWVQPTGSTDAYNIGDRVSFEGANYESVIAANVWSPAVYPAGWVLIP